jgi:hypothetical protein
MEEKTVPAALGNGGHRLCVSGSFRWAVEISPATEHRQPPVRAVGRSHRFLPPPQAVKAGSDFGGILQMRRVGLQRVALTLTPATIGPAHDRPVREGLVPSRSSTAPPIVQTAVTGSTSAWAVGQRRDPTALSASSHRRAVRPLQALSYARLNPWPIPLINSRRSRCRGGRSGWCEATTIGNPCLGEGQQGIGGYGRCLHAMSLPNMCCQARSPSSESRTVSSLG